MENPKFQIFRSAADGQFYFRLRARNGEIVLKSEGYVTKAGCHDGIKSVRANAPFERNYARGGSAPALYFSLRAANFEKIGQSETYTTSAAREQGIEACKAVAPTAPIEDLAHATI